MSDLRERTRAEIARERRAQRAARDLEITARRATKPIMVTSRTPLVSIPARQQQAAVKPPRFSVALGLPHFVSDHPSISVKRLYASWRFASVVIVLSLGIVLYLAFTLPFFRVSSAVVFGNTRIPSDELSAALGVTGKSIFTMSPEELETRLRMSYPELLSAEVKISMPNHVLATVIERRPVILWQRGDGYTWIDSEGVAFRPRGLKAGLVPVEALDELPPADSAQTMDDPLSPPPYLEKEMVEAILALSPLLPVGETMRYDSTLGFGWKDPRGWQVNFGLNAEDMPLKARIYQAMVDQLMAQNIYPMYINVMYPDAPYYRMAALEKNQLTEETVDSDQ